MKEIEISTQWIDRFGENDLNDHEKHLFQRQLRMNPILKSEAGIEAKLNRFLIDRDTIELMQKIRHVAVKPYLYNRRLSTFMIAASVIFLLAFGTTYYLMRTDPVKIIRYSGYDQMTGTIMRVKGPSAFQLFREGERIAAITPVTRRANSVKLSRDEAYTPMYEYELLVGAATRSGIVRLISPVSETNTKLNEEVQFRWEGDQGNFPVTIVLINNHGKMVLASPGMLRTKTFTIDTDVIGKGLFYWKFLVNDEIVRMGKMMIH